MNRKVFQLAWAAVLVITATLACNFLSNIRGDIGGARNTVISVATQAGGIITQVEGAATALDESAAMETAKAFVTEQGPAALSTIQALGTQLAESGYLPTFQAEITERVPQAMETFRALATQAAGSGAMQTMEAVATEQGDEIQATLRALPTIGLNNPPEDIPLPDEAGLSGLFASESFVTFQSPQDLRTLVEFYENALPQRGWSRDSDGNLETDSLAISNYIKENRRATLIVTAIGESGLTNVLLLIRAE